MFDISYLIFSIIEKNVAKLSFAAVVIGALRVNIVFFKGNEYSFALLFLESL